MKGYPYVMRRLLMAVAFIALVAVAVNKLLSD
jgi:hypothetical protein